MLATLAHRQPDRIPYHVSFTQPAWRRMADFYGDERFDAQLGNCLTWLGTGLPDGWREVEPGIWADEFGVRWNRTIDRDIGVVCNQCVTLETIAEFIFPDPEAPARYAVLREITAARGDRFVVADLGFSLFERAWTLAGMENVLMWMVTEPAALHRLLERITAHNLRIVAQACALDIDAFYFGDDWGQQRGLIMGQRLWREFIRPCLAEMYGAVKRRGKYVFIHSCGKVDELFPDLIELGLDVFNPFQPEVMDVYEMKRRHGDRLTFFGGISTQRTLPYGTVAQVRDEVDRLLKEVGRHGGLIAAPAHGIPGDARPENVHAMLERLRQG
jgi:uroporphyrinogen decarboxylase